MNIKQKLTLAFAVIACVPVVLVAVLIILNLRSEARTDFLDGSDREIRQVDNAMQLFFQGISQNVEFLAGQPQLQAIDGELKSYVAADATGTPMGEQMHGSLEVSQQTVSSINAASASFELIRE